MSAEMEIRFTAELTEIRAALTQLTAQVTTFNQRTAASAAGTRGLATGMSQAAIQSRAAAQATEQMRASVVGAVANLRLLVGTLGLAGLASGLVRMADTATLLRGQLTLATKTQEEFNAAQEATFEIAQRTRQGLEATVNLYARIARAGRTTQTQTLALTESINQAVALSFTTAQAGEAALFQLGQGLASGTLRGEELNSVLEQTPRLAQAIAEGLVEMGKIDTTAQLRKFAADGKLTADLVTQAVQTQQRVLREEFAKLPPTVGQAFTMLRNAALQFVGDVDSARGTTRELAEAIMFLAENLATLANLLTTGAKLWAGWYVAFRLVPAAVAALGLALASLRTSAAIATPAMAAFQARVLAMQVQVVGATSAVNAFSLSMNGAALAAASNASKMRAAALIAFAAWTGWEIGSYLREEFQAVEIFGIALSAGLVRVATAWQNAYLTAHAVIRAAVQNTYNAVLDTTASALDRLAAVQERMPLVGERLASATRSAAEAAREARVATASVGTTWDAMVAKMSSDDQAIQDSFGEIVDAAGDARRAQQAAGAAGAAGAGETEKALGGAANAWRLLQDAAERALRTLEQRYEDAGITTRDYFAERVRLQQASIDAQIGEQRAALAAATTEQARAAALTQLVILERERRDVALQGARDQTIAERTLAEQLAEVYNRTLELSGETAQARTNQLQAQYHDLLARLRADSDQAGIDMVENLINLEGARAQLSQLKEEFSRTTGELSQLQQTSSAQVAAGLLSNSTAERDLQEARAKTLEQLREQRESVAALYEQYGDPDALAHLQQLDQQIAQLSRSTQDWRGKIQDVATGALTTLFTDLADGSKDAGEALKDFVRNFVAGMAQIAAQALATYLVLQLLDAIYPGLGKATAAMMSVGANHTGGMAGQSHIRREVPAWLFSGAPRYHTGGVAGLAPDEVPAILQKEEEVLTRNDPRHRYNGGMGGGDSAQVQFRTPIVAIGDDAFSDALQSAAGEAAVVAIVQRNWEGLQRG